MQRIINWIRSNFSSRRRVLRGAIITSLLLVLAVFGYNKLFKNADTFIPNITGALAKALTASTATIEVCPPAGIPGMPGCSGNASNITQPIITNINDQVANAADACLSDYLNALNQNNKDGSIPIDVPEDGTKTLSITSTLIPNVTCTGTVNRNGILPELDSLNVIKPISVSLKITQTLVADTSPVTLGFSASSTKNEVIETIPMSGSVSADAQTYLLYNKDAKAGERFWTRGLKPFATALTDRYTLSNSKGVFNGSYKIQINSRDDVFDQKLAAHKLDDFLKVNGLNTDTVVFDQKVNGADDTLLNAGMTSGSYADGDTAREHRTFWYESSVGTFDGGIGFSWGPDTSGAPKTTLSSLSFCPNGCTLTNTEERNIRATKSAVATTTPQSKYPDDFLATSCVLGSGKCSYAALFSWMKHTETYSGKGVADLATGTIRWDKEFKVVNKDESKDRSGMEAKTINSVLGANAAVGSLPDMKTPRAWTAGGNLTDYEYTYSATEANDSVIDGFQYLATNNIQTVLYPFKSNLTEQTVTSSSKLEHSILNINMPNNGIKRTWKKINDASYTFTRSGSGTKPLYNKIPTVTASKYSKSITDSSSGCGVGTSQSWTGHFVAGSMSAPVVDTYKKCATTMGIKPAIPAIIDSTQTRFMGNAHYSSASWLTPIHFEYLNGWYDKNGNLIQDSGYGYGSDGIVQTNILEMDSDSNGVADCIASPADGATLVGGNFLYNANGTIERCSSTVPLREHTFLTMPSATNSLVSLATFPIKVLPNTMTMISAWDTADTNLNSIYTPYANAAKNLMAEVKQLNPQLTTNLVSSLSAPDLMGKVSGYKNGWLSVLAPSFDEGLTVGKYTNTNPSLMFGLINSKVLSAGSNYFPVSQNNCNGQPSILLRDVYAGNTGVFKGPFGQNASTALGVAFDSYRKTSNGKTIDGCPGRSGLLYYNADNLYQAATEIGPKYITLAPDGSSIIYFSQPDSAFFKLPINLSSDETTLGAGQIIGSAITFSADNIINNIKYSPDRAKAYLFISSDDGDSIVLYDFVANKSTILPANFGNIDWVSNSVAVAYTYDGPDKLIQVNVDGTGRKDLATLDQLYEQMAISGNSIALWTQKDYTTGTLELRSMTGSIVSKIDLPYVTDAHIIPSPVGGNFVVTMAQDDGTTTYWLVKANGTKQQLNLNILANNITWKSDGSGLLYIHQTETDSPFVFSNYTLSDGKSIDIRSYDSALGCSDASELITLKNDIFFNCSGEVVGFK